VADFDIAERLEIAVNSPVGMLRRVLCDEEGTAIYIGDITYRGDLVRLEMNLNR
jgi:GntR family transcriptional regulator